MNIALSLRSADLKSMLPEVTVTLAEVILAGELGLTVEATPDYPFLGMSQVDHSHQSYHIVSLTHDAYLLGVYVV